MQQFLYKCQQNPIQSKHDPSKIWSKSYIYMICKHMNRSPIYHALLLELARARIVVK